MIQAYTNWKASQCVYWAHWMCFHLKNKYLSIQKYKSPVRKRFRCANTCAIAQVYMCSSMCVYVRTCASTCVSALVCTSSCTSAWASTCASKQVSKCASAWVRKCWVCKSLRTYASAWVRKCASAWVCKYGSVQMQVRKCSSTDANVKVLDQVRKCATT